MAKKSEIVQNLGVSGSSPDVSWIASLGPLSDLLPTPHLNDVPGQAIKAVLPDTTFTEIRKALTQTEKSVAAIVDLADLISTDPPRYQLDEKKSIALLKNAYTMRHTY